MRHPTLEPDGPTSRSAFPKCRFDPLSLFPRSTRSAVVVAGLLFGISLASARESPGTQQPSEEESPGQDRLIDLRKRAAPFRDRTRIADAPGQRGVPGSDVPLDGFNETTIAVNPNDPMNLAYSSLLELRVSTDGGSTWEPPVVPALPTSHILGGDPSLAFDSQGRLFWAYLALPFTTYIFASGIDMFIAQCDPTTGQILPGYPVNVTEEIGLPATAGNSHDKEWLAADCNPASPFRDNLYLVWCESAGGNFRVLTTSSSDQGMTWSSAIQLAGAGGAFKWPTHVTVGPLGDVYVADHRGTVSAGVPDGVSGRVHLFRSTDGGASFTLMTRPFAHGEADMTFNRQNRVTGVIPGTDFLLQGSSQPWILADPNTPGRIYAVANDDPDNDIDSGDPADVYFNVSTDHGATWATPRRIDGGPGTTFQVMPTAAIDKQSGAIVVHYYDNRAGAVNGNGNFLLDVFATVSLDGGLTWGCDFQINDTPFDPDPGAGCHYDCGEFINDVWGSSGVEAFAGTQGGGILGFDGASWSSLYDDTTPKYGIWGSGVTNVLTCGRDGQLLRWDGSQATAQSSGTTERLFGIDGRSANEIYVAGANGTALRYDGNTWSSMTPPTSEDLHDVWVNPVGDVWFVGNNGIVLRHDGVSWDSLPLGSVEKLGGAWGSSDSDVWVTDWHGTLHHWNGAWSSQPSGLESVSGIWGSGASNVLAFGWGQIVRYDGVSWTRESASEDFLWKAHGTGPSRILAGGGNAAIALYDGSWTLQPNPGQSPAPTRRIGEYNGIAAGGGRAFAVWCGNTTLGGGVPHDQQAIFDSFATDWQVSVVEIAATSSEVELEPARPNPASGAVAFAYSIPQAGRVSLSLFDVGGRRVASLIQGEQPAGRHVVPWDGREATGRAVAPGAYFLRLEAGSDVRSQKVVLTR